MSADLKPTAAQGDARREAADRLASERPAWLRYGVAIALTLLSVWLRVALAPADSGGRFVTPALAVALTTLYGGLGPGLVSTFLGMALVNFFMVEPYGSFAFNKSVEAFWLNAWHLVTQLVVVGAISLMQSRNRQLQEATRQIRDGQQRFLDTFEYAASGITHVDTQGRLLRTNETFCRMVGYSKSELEGMSFQDITVADDLSSDLRLLKETLAGLRSTYTLEKRYRHKEGHLVWAQLTVALMRTPDGEPDYFISVVQDISAQKAAEEALRTSREPAWATGTEDWRGCGRLAGRPDHGPVSSPLSPFGTVPCWRFPGRQGVRHRAAVVQHHRTPTTAPQACCQRWSQPRSPRDQSPTSHRIPRDRAKAAERTGSRPSRPEFELRRARGVRCRPWA